MSIITTNNMETASKIYVAGHSGMVGSAIVRALQERGYNNLITRSSSGLDLRNQQAVNNFFHREGPEFVIIAAAKVGGIGANDSYKAEFLYDNLMIAANVIHASYLNNVKKLLFLGSSCIYPKLSNQPISEEALLTGPLEPTNEPYAIAKIAGIKLCDTYRQQFGCDFISAMPTNLYGPNDNYDLEASHVMPALIRKIHEAKQTGRAEVEIWGSGLPLREFLHVDDLAEACLFLMEEYSQLGHINVGSGQEVSIRDLANVIAQVIGYQGDFSFDRDKPDGTPRKLMDSSVINELGWCPAIELRAGITSVYRELVENQKLN